MQVDYLIIGQGISGTWLSYYLQKGKKSFIVIDNNFKNSPSRICAGIINPVTGRRHVKVWMAEEILSYAWNAYNEIGETLGITAISQKNIIDFFPSAQMRQSFFQRIDEKGEYVFDFPEQNHFINFFNYDFGCGEINPAYTTHPETVLPAWRQQLKLNNQLLEEEFELGELIISADHIRYKDVTASAIIFCDGKGSVDNPYFKQLPFAPNKGELLIAEIPHLPEQHIYKKGIGLVPLSSPGLFWIGSGYEWEFENDEPTTGFREKTEQLLKNWLKMPFKIIDHLAGIRPATLERRPFVGMHPLYPNIGILNGMGSKGNSLAPFFAHQLVEHLLQGSSIVPEADVKRFSRILSRSN